MKNLMIYTGNGGFPTEEDATLARIQIDNSLDLGWKHNDILFFTDFQFEYNGVAAHVIPEQISYDHDKKANKIAVILYLLDQGILADDISWCHDLDAFELNRIDHVELEGKPLGLAPYYYKDEYSFSNFFFTRHVRPLFTVLDSGMTIMKYKSRSNEKAFGRLLKLGAIKKDEFKELNVTYHIAKRCLRTIYPVAEKPIKVLHFRPSDKDKLMPDTALNMFMYGKNSLKIPLMNERLIKIFNYHGIR